MVDVAMAKGNFGVAKPKNKSWYRQRHPLLCKESVCLWGGGAGLPMAPKGPPPAQLRQPSC